MRFAYRNFNSFLTFEKFLNDNNIGSRETGWHLQGWQDVETRHPTFNYPHVEPDIRVIFYSPNTGEQANRELPRGDR